MSKRPDRLTLFLRALLPRPMAAAFLDQADDLPWLAERLKQYLGADEATKADIEAFFESDGPAKVKDTAGWVALGIDPRSVRGDGEASGEEEVKP